VLRPDPGENRLARDLEATTDLERAAKSSPLIFIIIATPTDGGKYYYDHGGLSSLFVTLNSFKLQNVEIVINSTVFPGYIQNIGSQLLADCASCSLSYNPAFVAQGDVITGYSTGGWFGMVLIGAANDVVARTLSDIYKRIAGENSSDVNICVMSPASAEICKLASNCFRTTKISFANMIGDIADRSVGADKHEICNALKMRDALVPLINNSRSPRVNLTLHLSGPRRTRRVIPIFSILRCECACA